MNKGRTLFINCEMIRTDRPTNCQYDTSIGECTYIKNNPRCRLDIRPYFLDPGGGCPKSI